MAYETPPNRKISRLPPHLRDQTHLRLLRRRQETRQPANPSPPSHESH